MFGWFWAWLERRRLGKRALFRFHDGRRWRYVDPFRTWRELDQHPRMKWDMLEFVEAGHHDETVIVLDAVCEVFGLQQWNEATRSGLTDSEVLGVLMDFNLYLASLKKSISPSPTSPAPTGSESSPQPATASTTSP